MNMQCLKKNLESAFFLKILAKSGNILRKAVASIKTREKSETEKCRLENSLLEKVKKKVCEYSNELKLSSTTKSDL